MGESLYLHYFSVVICVGATTVNAYLAQESIAERHRRGLFGDRLLEDCVQSYIKAVDDGLLKIMSKMGIAVISSYRGGCNFEAVGLRSEEHTSELQSLMRISYAVFCLKKKKK